MLCFSVFLIKVHKITLIDSGYRDLSQMSMLQSTRCDVLIGHLWITGQALEPRMWQTSICQQHDLQAAGVFLKKKLGKGWMPGRQEQVFNLYFIYLFFLLYLPRTLPEFKIGTFCFTPTQPFASKPHAEASCLAHASFTRFSWQIHISLQTHH